MVASASSGESNPVTVLSQQQQKERLPTPTYQYEKLGEMPDLLWRCAVTVNSSDTHAFQVTSAPQTSKKEAKADAASIALVRLEAILQVKLLERNPPSVSLDTAGQEARRRESRPGQAGNSGTQIDPVSKLSQRQEKNSLPFPTYDFESQGEGHPLLWRCSVSVYAGRQFEATSAVFSTKKQAKVDATLLVLAQMDSTPAVAAKKAKYELESPPGQAMLALKNSGAQADPVRELYQHQQNLYLPHPIYSFEKQGEGGAAQWRCSVSVPIARESQDPCITATSAALSSKKEARIDVALQALAQLASTPALKLVESDAKKKPQSEALIVLNSEDRAHLNLNEQIHIAAKALSPTSEQDADNEQTLRSLTVLAAEHGFTLAVFGSFGSGTADVESDLDVTILRRSAESMAGKDRAASSTDLLEPLSGSSAEDLLRALMAPLAARGFSVELASARIPVLKLVGQSGIKCDVSVERLQSLERTSGIKKMIEIDPALTQVVLVLKEWRRRRGLARFLSSYCVTLLTIFVMQTSAPARLPPWTALQDEETPKPLVSSLVLDREGAEGGGRPEDEGRRKKEEEEEEEGKDRKVMMRGGESKGERECESVLRAFFSVFAAWDFDEDGVCVREGKRVDRRKDGGMSQLRKDQANHFCVEDPVDIGDNVARNIGRGSRLNRLKRELQRGLHILSPPSSSSSSSSSSAPNASAHASLAALLAEEAEGSASVPSSLAAPEAGSDASPRATVAREDAGLPAALM